MSWMTNAWAVGDHAALDELGEALNVDLPELLTDVSDLLRSRWPDYAQFLDENRPSVTEVAVPFVHRLLETAWRELANLESAPFEAEPALQLAFEQIGRLQCLQGRELMALLSAYRVGARAAWRHVSATAVRLDLPPNVFAALGDAVFVFVDQLASASAHGYVQEQSRSGAERERLAVNSPTCCCPTDPTPRQCGRRPIGPTGGCQPRPRWSSSTSRIGGHCQLEVVWTFC